MIFTISEESQKKRLAEQARGNEVWKSKGEEFQRKLNKSYLKVAKEFNIPTLSTEASIEEVHEELKKLLDI